MTINDLLKNYGLAQIVPSQKTKEMIKEINKVDLTKLTKQMYLLANPDDTYNVTLRDPVAYIIQHPDQIKPITDGRFPRNVRASKAKIQKREYSMYVPPEVITELMNK